MEIRALNLSDCPQIAKLHLKAFNSFFLTSLGQTFLVTFYASVIKHNSGITVGLFDNQNIVAFAVGTSKKRGFYSEILKKNGLILLLKSAPSLFKSPNRLIRLAKVLKTKDSTDDYILDNATLLSICVNPLYNEKGLGTKILTAFEAIAFQISNGISLTTDADNNDYVNHYYQKNGYDLLKQFEQGKRIMNLYYKEKNV
jgi:ribosomal protein S18 acetylase RimI-like enzyme